MFATLPSPDGCALNDVQFGFQEKAKAAIETIQSFDDPQCLVIGVEGRWGSGKTVFLDCMKGALPKNTQSSPECMIHSPVFLGLLHGFRVCLGVLGLVWVLENWDTVEKCWKGICQFVSNTPFTTSFTNCMLVFTTLVFLCATAPFIFLIVRKLSGVVKMILQAMDALWQKGFLGEGENKNTTANLKEYNKSQAYHVTVSPWLYKGKDDLIETLFSDISACLDQALGQKENLKNIREGFKALATAYSKVGDTHDRVLSIAIHLFQFWTNEALELKKQRERLKTALKVGKVPIYVFIDDLDRLSQHEVLQVLDFLRHVGDLPYVRYIIAYDRNYVKEAIHKELYPAFVQDESKPQDFSEASRYLEKILWLEILLPQLTNQDY
ncbi:MAG: P-loop NTPase fold protein, partial [Vampirovibrionales bacterium]